jgi:UDPglucose--hexose-1-phosphate uridylyltransferase
MPDLRFDIVSGNWVCIAEGRMERPVEFLQKTTRKPGLDCPFCFGNESLTPEIAGVREGPQGWLCRTFLNRYPAFYAENGTGGYQEIMVLSPRHVVSFGELNDDEVAACMSLLAERLRFIQQNPSVRHVILFMNCRPMSGASIEHAHFQLVGLPLATPAVDQRMARCSKGAFVELVKHERREKIRWLREYEHWVAWCPEASSFIGQVRIAPREQAPLSGMREDQLTELGKLLRSVALAADLIFERPDYNIIFQLPAVSEPSAIWFIEFVPRFPQMAGLEIGTNLWVNPLSPESAARKYRAAMV